MKSVYRLVLPYGICCLFIYVYLCLSLVCILQFGKQEIVSLHLHTSHFTLSVIIEKCTANSFSAFASIRTLQLARTNYSESTLKSSTSCTVLLHRKTTALQNLQNSLRYKHNVLLCSLEKVTWVQEQMTATYVKLSGCQQ